MKVNWPFGYKGDLPLTKILGYNFKNARNENSMMFIAGGQSYTAWLPTVKLHLCQGTVTVLNIKVDGQTF